MSEVFSKFLKRFNLERCLGSFLKEKANIGQFLYIGHYILQRKVGHLYIGAGKQLPLNVAKVHFGAPAEIILYISAENILYISAENILCIIYTG